MKHRFIIAAVLLLVAGMQTGFAQTLTLHFPNQEKIKYNVSELESVTFEAEGEGPIIVNGHEFVDLGLPSGTLWATTNIGADTPEDYGDYFAWGEKETKPVFNWNTYLLANYNNRRLTKYCTNASYGNDGFTDNLTELEAGDDAAAAIWGRGCQMPCREQFGELMDTSYVTKKSVRNGNLRGLEITSKQNGKSIYLPGAGYFDGNAVQQGGTYGFYWSRSLFERIPVQAYFFYFMGTVSRVRQQERYLGSSIRPVCTMPAPYRWLVKDISLNYTQLDLPKGTTEQLKATIVPSYATNTDYTTESSDESVATVSSTGLVKAIAEGTCVITFRATDGSDQTATCQITVTTQGSTSGHEWVDLGLPSGTIWATCNIGANSPTEYGDYFAWGETQPKEEYTWGTYTYCEGTYKTQVKYNSEDCKTWLQTTDDAAYVNWSSKWQMPSKEQLEELLNENYTTIEQTTLEGVNGRIITSKFNNKSVFFPNAGCYSMNGFKDEGSCGHYWTRTLNSEYAWYSHCLLSQPSNIISTYGYRYPGKSVRPVLHQEIVYLNSILLDKSGLCLTQNASAQLTATVSPGNALNSDVLWKSSNPSIASVNSNGLVTAGTTGGTCIITCFAADGSGTKATCLVTVIGDLCPNSTHPHVIDLGLPSGTKWCCCNVGAKAPIGYGNYYSWGDTSPKEDYSSSNYNSNITTDIAGTSYDVALEYMGSPWQMPTYEQMNELVINCYSAWTTLNDINGVIITGPNGKQIFLPAGGQKSSASTYYLGTEGMYWTSTPDTYNNVKYLDFSTGGSPHIWVGRNYYGLTVRAVQQ